MSENISVRKDGTEWSGQVDEVRIKKSSGGTEDWAPQVDGNLVKLKIGENGTYKAADYDAYGISVVEATQSVNHVQSAADGNVKPVEGSVVISEGGVGRYMVAKKVRFNRVGGGTVDMVSEGAYKLGTLHVTQKGVYKAKEENLGGYSQVVVNIPESHNGGGDGGWTNLPDEIRVTTMPDKTAYGGAETIDYTGLAVTAYRKNKPWSTAEYPGGRIPFYELDLPAVTIGDESIKLGLIGSVSEDDFRDDPYGPQRYQWFLNHLPIWFKLNGTSYYMRGNAEVNEPVLLIQCSGNQCVAPFYTIGGGMTFVIASNAPFSCKADTSRAEDRYTHTPVRVISAYAYTNRGKTVYLNYITVNVGEFVSSNCVEAINYLNSGISKAYIDYVAWFMLYGGTQLSIPVQWARPRDHRILETSFRVTAPLYAETHEV